MVPATVLVALNEDEPPKHIVDGVAIGVTTGFGFTVIVYVDGVPVQPFTVGVTVIVAVIGALVALVAVNPGTSPVLLSPNPIATLELPHPKIPPAGLLTKFVAGTASPLHTTIFAGTITVGVGLIVIVFVAETAAQPPAAAILLVTV